MNSIDQLIYEVVFSKNQEAGTEIRNLAKESGVFLASILPLYKAIGTGTVSGFTVPAINIRALTYETARAIFRVMNKHQVGPVVFEIARSEIDYTDQRPDEYALCVLAAAIKENYQGPVFIQADHVQFSKNKFSQDPKQETEKIKALVKEAISAGFYNVDIDASTLVDLEKENLDEQQAQNFKTTAELTNYIHSLQPQDIQISIGGEIGHIGGKNSTVSDFEAFMNGYNSLIPSNGISKVSVQTGTSHGGIPLPDGKIADVKLDFSVLEDIGKVAREKYHMAGAVQHGASTLPNELFHTFPEIGTTEIHLATGFQNIVYDNMPDELKQEMYNWVKENCKAEWTSDQNEEQFVYKTRKKALGPFKKQLWDLEDTQKQKITDALEKQFAFLFEQLKVFNTKEIVTHYVPKTS